jgi:hypothetical protein
MPIFGALPLGTCPFLPRRCGTCSAAACSTGHAHFWRPTCGDLPIPRPPPGNMLILGAFPVGHAHSLDWQAGIWGSCPFLRVREEHVQWREGGVWPHRGHVHSRAVPRNMSNGRKVMPAPAMDMSTPGARPTGMYLGRAHIPCHVRKNRTCAPEHAGCAILDGSPAPSPHFAG